MLMFLYAHINWMLFCIFFAAMLLCNFIMSRQSESFYTMHMVIRKFSMLDLEFPGSAIEFAEIIKGIFFLPGALSKKTLRSLKGQLYLDFLFMLSTYGSVFILCMKVSVKMTSVGRALFIVLAWMQLLAFVCDIIENIYLLNKLNPKTEVSKPSNYKAYQINEISKWAIVLTAAVCSISAMFYFWLVGRYSYHSINYLLIIIAEIFIFFILKKLSFKNEKEKLENFQQNEK